MIGPDATALLVSASAREGGAERTLSLLAERLPDLGFAVRAHLLEDGPLVERLRAAGAEVSLDPVDRIRRVDRTLAVAQRLRRRVREADVVLSSGSVSHIYAGLAALGTGTPVVHRQTIMPSGDQGGPPMFDRRVEAVASRLPAALVVVNSGETAARQRVLTPNRPIELIHPGIDLDAVRLARCGGRAIRASLGWGDDVAVVGIAGWIRRWKGQDVFVRAAAAVAEQRPDVRFLVAGGVGEPDFADEVASLAAELGIADRVATPGRTDDIHEAIDAMDVAVLASWGEAFGLVVVEAMALGTPVVATSVGGPAEIVREGVDGHLVAPGDAAAMASAIGAILDDDGARAAMGRAALERAEGFSADRTAAGFADAFRRVIGRS